MIGIPGITVSVQPQTSRRTWMVIREVATDELRLASLPAGQRPAADPAYRCAGPYRSKAAANRAVSQKSSALHAMLYGDGKQFVVETAGGRSR